MNLYIVIPLALILSVIVASVVGAAISTPDEGDFNPYFTTEDLLLVMKRAKWEIYKVTPAADFESVRVIEPPYDWAEETD